MEKMKGVKNQVINAGKKGKAKLEEMGVEPTVKLGTLLQTGLKIVEEG